MNSEFIARAKLIECVSWKWRFPTGISSLYGYIFVIYIKFYILYIICIIYHMSIFDVLKILIFHNNYNKFSAMHNDQRMDLTGKLF